ncbi:hypothetical protein QTO34_007159 [Cnephaeus nilssonii]|uniref:Uncharacterized protein n=1 Tax=Cnephaeus nilssonii TaxID=3371016 RepID=A0AA40HKP4_CNENI|nr:hypothetical protein QTO34_007159 [Eptesicus nilssonii]
MEAALALERNLSQALVELQALGSTHTDLQLYSSGSISWRTTSGVKLIKMGHTWLTSAAAWDMFLLVAHTQDQMEDDAGAAGGPGKGGCGGFSGGFGSGIQAGVWAGAEATELVEASI